MEEQTIITCPFTKSECNTDCALNVWYFDARVCAFVVMSITAHEFREVYGNVNRQYDEYESMGYNYIAQESRC